MADVMTRSELLARASELEGDADAHDKRGRSGPARRLRDEANTLRSMAQQAADDPAGETYELARGGSIEDHEARITALEEWHDEWRLRVLTSDPARVVTAAIDAATATSSGSVVTELDIEADVEPAPDADTGQDSVSADPPDGPTPGSDGADTPEVTVEAINYSEYTQEQLQDLLAARDLAVSGTKPEQIARLEADDADPGDTVDADDAVNGAS